MQNVPPEVQKYLSNEYLIDHSKNEIAINELLQYIQDEPFQFPRQSIKDIISILQDQKFLNPELIEKILFLLDISLSYVTPKKDEPKEYELSYFELFIIHKYFYHREGHAINILSHAISLSPVVSTTILDLFPSEKKYQGFNEAIIDIFNNKNLFNSFLPVLQLIFKLSDKEEIIDNFIDIFQALIPIIPTFKFDEQAVSFKILINFCKANKKFYSILYNNDYVEKLYSQIIIDSKSLNAGFKLIHLISDENNYRYPLEFIKRLKIEKSVRFAIENRQEKAIKLISDSFYEIMIGNNEAIDYFLGNDFLNMFISLESKVSFSTWQHVMEMICAIVYTSNYHQLEYIIKNSNIIILIAQMAENVDADLDSSQQIISEVITGALQNLFDIAKFEFDKHAQMIFTQELREQLQESALFENGNKYQPITNFIQSIDRLYNPDLDDDDF